MILTSCGDHENGKNCQILAFLLSLNRRSSTYICIDMLIGSCLVSTQWSYSWSVKWCWCHILTDRWIIVSFLVWYRPLIAYLNKFVELWNIQITIELGCGQVGQMAGQTPIEFKQGAHSSWFLPNFYFSSSKLSGF